ncbi:HD domain-containing protein [Rhodococcus sovatensis]|uniref:HD domain-containing protein n=1 Tax=Rhodococcus sovatensis TaxID=1805840 RepID=A0ABZ2PJZ6_9NOCA
MRTGELTRRGQLRVIGDALAIQTIAMPRLLRGIDAPSSPRFPGTRSTPPDSRLCRDALQEAEETLTPAVLAHSLRCWEFGSALAEVDGRSFDPENLYVAALLHDIRFGAPADDQVGCFAVLGAQHARAFVAAHGGSAASGHCVHTAIARHMDAKTPLDAGPEAALLHDAAHLDVVGLRAHELDAALLSDIESRFPRIGFADEFKTAMRAEAQLRPRSTAAALWRSGMRLAIALNPLDRGANQ